MLGSSEFAKVFLGAIWGNPPFLDLRNEVNLLRLLEKLAKMGLLRSARVMSDGGIAVTLAEAGFAKGIGVVAKIENYVKRKPPFDLFWKFASSVVISCDPDKVNEIEVIAKKFSYIVDDLGDTTSGSFEIGVNGTVQITSSIGELMAPWFSALEAALYGEVTA